MLLLGGPSGVGKTIVARQLGLRLGISWLQVDDLRLALQWSRVTFPRETAALYFFEETPGIWNLPPERLRDGLIAVGEVISPAIEVVITNHVDTKAPIIIEGDGILPSLFARPEVRDRVARRRGIAERTENELRTEARAKWLYGQWLTSEAQHYGMPVLESRPWSTLLERLIMHKSS